MAQARSARNMSLGPRAPKDGRRAAPPAFVALGTVLLTLSAKINLPLPYVPMTLQTLVVLMIGAAYGWRLGGRTMIAYLAEGAAGWPVFAGPVGGLAPLMGPTAGYLTVSSRRRSLRAGSAERGWDRSMARLFLAMALGTCHPVRRRFCLAGLGLRSSAPRRPGR